MGSPYTNDAPIGFVLQQLGRFGSSRVPLQVEIDGDRLVVAGPQIFSIPSEWSFREFLISYGLQYVGREIVEMEPDRAAPQHPLAYQLLAGSVFREDEGKGKLAAVNAEMESFIHVAWDIFTLADNEKMQEVLIKRLKNAKQYQGARYELFIAASLIRAGFKVEFEDESDINSTHCEFNAVSRATKKAYSVEAKSRHRDHSEGGKAGIYRLIQRALSKAASNERIVFIDVNLPHDTKAVFQEPWHREVMQTLSEVEEKQKPFSPWPQAILFFTNGMFSKVGFAGGNVSTVLLSAINHPLFKQQDRQVVEQAYPEIGILYGAVDNLGWPPNHFPGQHTDLKIR
jgi:hypothetical protein